MNNEEWLVEQLEELMQNEPQYEKRAFWQGLKTLILQQQQRQAQLQAEIDGRLWNHDNW